MFDVGCIKMLGSLSYKNMDQEEFCRIDWRWNTCIYL